MSKSNASENDTLKLFLQGVDPAWRAGPTIYLALYTADPGEAGTAITNEATYTGYARVGITKATGWTDGGSTFTNAAQVLFAQCTGGSETLNYGALVSTALGAGEIFYSGVLGSPLAIANLIRPFFDAGAISVTED